MVSLVRIIEGIALLTLGRKLFWLFVAAIGFEAGAFFVAHLMPRQPEWIVILIALGVGLLGALLAVVLQNIAIGVAGFVAGGVIAVGILDALSVDVSFLPLIAFVIGGIIGATLVAVLFDWALIGLSSLAGAITLTNVFLPRGALSLVVIVVLFLVGVAIQAGWLWFEGRKAQLSD